MGWHLSTVLKHMRRNKYLSPERRGGADDIVVWLGPPPPCGETSFDSILTCWPTTLPMVADASTYAIANNIGSVRRAAHDALVDYARRHEIPEDWDHTKGGR